MSSISPENLSSQNLYDEGMKLFLSYQSNGSSQHLSESLRFFEEASRQEHYPAILQACQIRLLSIRNEFKKAKILNRLNRTEINENLRRYVAWSIKILSSKEVARSNCLLDFSNAMHRCTALIAGNSAHYHFPLPLQEREHIVSWISQRHNNVSEDHVKVLHLFIRQGCALALTTLYSIYFERLSLSTNEGVKQFETLGKTYPIALGLLGMAYAAHKKNLIDPSKRDQLLQASAEKGSFFSIHRLSLRAYHNMDYVNAEKYASIGAKQNDFFSNLLLFWIALHAENPQRNPIKALELAQKLKDAPQLSEEQCQTVDFLSVFLRAELNQISSDEVIRLVEDDPKQGSLFHHTREVKPHLSPQLANFLLIASLQKKHDFDAWLFLSYSNNQSLFTNFINNLAHEGNWRFCLTQLLVGMECGLQAAFSLFLQLNQQELFQRDLLKHYQTFSNETSFYKWPVEVKTSFLSTFNQFFSFKALIPKSWQENTDSLGQLSEDFLFFLEPFTDHPETFDLISNIFTATLDDELHQQALSLAESQLTPTFSLHPTPKTREENWTPKGRKRLRPL